MTAGLYLDDLRPDGVTLRLRDGRGRLARLRGLPAPALRDVSRAEADIAVALAELQLLEDRFPGGIEIGADSITLSHQVVAALDDSVALAIGLPPLPDLVLRTDVDGVLGVPGFALRAWWEKDGLPVTLQRVGAIVMTPERRRLPEPILYALNLAEIGTDATLAGQWAGLARFRQALGEAAGTPVEMTNFLRGLEIRLASAFTIDPRDGIGGRDFDILARGEGAAFADAGDIAGTIRQRGALTSYSVGEGRFVVVDSAARPVLEAMTTAQRGPAPARDAFVRNPGPVIADAVEQDLQARGLLDGLDDAARAETVERAAAGAYVELEGYADRVLGIGTYRKPAEDFAASGVTWLPEIFSPAARQALEGMGAQELEGVHGAVAQAMAAGQGAASAAGVPIPATGACLAALDGAIVQRRSLEQEAPPEAETEALDGPQILVTAENYEQVDFLAAPAPRLGGEEGGAPEGLRTALHAHQLRGLEWAQQAWRAGLPGILNADEQELGKTLQTLAFLSWLQERMAAGGTAEAGPILIVAPTSLLTTWEAEVETHLDARGLGGLIRLYGSGIAAFRAGTGRETADGMPRLDLDLMRRIIGSGDGRGTWVLTTYQTMTNYQHSLGRIRFAAMVMDEVQALKNPGSQAARAGMAMNADFRIALTGTPVENDVVDLWAIMEQVAKGGLGSLRDFRKAYGTGEAEPLERLHARIFAPGAGRQAMGLRRLKREVVDLPAKRRFLHPRLMPPAQASAYEDGRRAFEAGGAGAALKMLHRLRGTSLHPDPGAAGDFADGSARVAAAIDILHRVRDAGERALVFVEDLKVQARFIAEAKRVFDLDRVDVINGGTPIPKRQKIVKRFQSGARGFDVLVLSPKAAGTGLTLTAATQVIHLSRWWNPAVEEQCNDRVHRIGQDREVRVHMPMALHPDYGIGSFDGQLHLLMERKRGLAQRTLSPAADTDGDVAAMVAAMTGAGAESGRGGLEETVAALHAALGRSAAAQGADGSWEMS